MKHIERTLTALVKQWRTEGFEGVRFVECRMQLFDREPDEQTVKEYNLWRRDYGTFIAQPEEPCFDLIDHPYYDVIEVGSIEEDMEEAIREKLGPDVTIKYQPGCSEWEVYRRNQSDPPRTA